MMSGVEWMGIGAWVWIALGVVLVVAVAWLVGSVLPGRARGARGDDPKTILKLRLARGEITQAEYEQALRVLGN